MFQITIGVKRFAIDHTFCRIKICRVNQLKINGLFGFTDPAEKNKAQPVGLILNGLCLINYPERTMPLR